MAAAENDKIRNYRRCLIKIFFIFLLTPGLIAAASFGQEQNNPAKIINRLSPNLKPVPEARVEITISGKSRSVQTDEYGVFGIEISDPEKIFGDEKSLKVKLLVTTFPPLQKTYSDFPLTVEISREEGPLYALAVAYNQNINSLLVIKLKADLMLLSPPAGIMLRKSYPFPDSSKYHKQVAVF